MVTTKQQAIIDKSRQLMPSNFSVNTTDEKILMFADIVLNEINVFAPASAFTTEDAPDNILPILYFGISVFAALFLQMGAALDDFEYNDNGLYVRVDQTAKIDMVYKNLVETFRMMITNYKKTQIFEVGPKGIGSPRYQTQLGQFLKIALGSAFNWNTPS